MTAAATNNAARRRSSGKPKRTTQQIKADACAIILAQMDELDLAPWHMPWVKNLHRQQNALTGKPYRGANTWFTAARNYQDHRWVTYKQAEKLDGHVRKGEKGTRILFWKFPETSQDKETDADDRPAPRRYAMPLVRESHVFNIAQCDGLNLPAVPELNTGHTWSTDFAIQLVDAMPNPPQLSWGHNQALYIPRADRIEMPDANTFESQETLASTFYHELAHATVHPSRLHRFEADASINLHERAEEELVAEITAAMMLAYHDLQPPSENASAAAYIKNWRQQLRDRPEHLFNAAQRSQRVFDLLTAANNKTAAAPTC